MAPDGVMIPSFYNWDSRTHKLEDDTHVNVDGGLDEVYSHNSTAPYFNMSVYSDDPFEIQRRFFCRLNVGIDGKSKKRWTPLFQMSDNWLKNVIDTFHIMYDITPKMIFFRSLYEKEVEYRKLNHITVEE